MQRVYWSANESAQIPLKIVITVLHILVGIAKFQFRSDGGYNVVFEDLPLHGQQKTTEILLPLLAVPKNRCFYWRYR